MKTIIPLILLTFFLVSCKSTTYYQVYNTEATSPMEIKDQYLIYEDENAIVYYDLWGEGGNMGFKFYNKTNETIYLNLDNSYFIHNGIAYDYYKNRTYSRAASSATSLVQSSSTTQNTADINYLDLFQTQTSKSGQSVNLQQDESYSTTFIDEKVMYVPAKSAKIITEFSVNNSLYRNCDLYRFPNKQNIKSSNFTEQNSPFNFSNRITYQVGRESDLIKFENTFYVSAITNYPEKEITTTEREAFCEETIMRNVTYLKDAQPDKFYVKYTKGKNEQLEH